MKQVNRQFAHDWEIKLSCNNERQNRTLEYLFSYVIFDCSKE